MRNKSGLKLPVRSSTYPCGEWREEEGPQPCPHPIRCQDLQGRRLRDLCFLTFTVGWKVGAADCSLPTVQEGNE